MITVAKLAVTPELAELLHRDGADKTEHYQACCCIALAVQRAGGSEQDYEQLLDGSDLARSYKYGERKRRYDVHQAWEFSEQHFEPETPAEALEAVRDDLVNLRRRIEESNLPQRVLPTVLAVVDEGIRRGAWTMDLSVRDLGLVVGRSPATVSRHLNTAEQAGCLYRTPAEGGLAGKVTLEVTFGEVAQKGKNETHKETLGTSYVLQNSLFSGHGLGPTAGRLWNALLSLNRVSSAAEVARAAGVDPKTARVHLPRMAEVGLVDTIRKGKRTFYAPATEPDLEVACFLAGVDDSREQQQARFDAERELYARVLATRAPEDNAPAEQEPQPATGLFDAPSAPGLTESSSGDLRSVWGNTLTWSAA